MSEFTTTPESTETTLDLDIFFTETMSPYGLITSVNKVLKELGIDKVLPGPMGYTYCKKGYIATVPGSNNKVVEKEAAIEWAEKYLTKLVTKLTSVKVEEVEESEIEEDIEAK